MSQPVAFVTGCSSGIGRALADAFQRAGYRVWASAAASLTSSCTAWKPASARARTSSSLRALA
ncbi:SDR family NAD(P)-dependent oxidoreductase, partial [Pseudomonas aeruginosa]|uniref:SDR family NAD(P)-dependent oxidoreductase n=1 Tax=Pseudomonas aeruginosa TaxID=287 RepID=UPI002237C77D